MGFPSRRINDNSLYMGGSLYHLTLVMVDERFGITGLRLLQGDNTPGAEGGKVTLSELWGGCLLAVQKVQGSCQRLQVPEVRIPRSIEEAYECRGF
jgi:hypothetical protein